MPKLLLTAYSEEILIDLASLLFSLSFANHAGSLPHPLCLNSGRRPGGQAFQDFRGERELHNPHMSSTSLLTSFICGLDYILLASILWMAGHCSSFLLSHIRDLRERKPFA